MNLYLEKHLTTLNQMKKTNHILKIFKLKWIQHLIFWVLSLYFITFYFAISNTIKFIDFVYSLIFHIPLLGLVFLNLNLLLPFYLKNKKYLYYVFLVIINLILAYGIHGLIFEIILTSLPIEYYIVSFTDYKVLLLIFIIYLIITSLLKLSSSWYLLQKVEKEKVELELNSLKSQVNPHFLFNSLNSIYSLSLKKDDKTPKLILGLSQLLRYMLYEIKEKKVLLSKELEIMNQYIELQKIRLDKSSKISLKIIGNVNNQMVAPLLFFPLIENSFKYGAKGTSNNCYIFIILTVNENNLNFEITNNKGVIDDVENAHFGGIGLANVKKRLQLIYPSSDMSIEQTDTDFKVNINMVL